MIKYNNSMYTANPPAIIVEPPTPTEWVEETINNHLDEENYNLGFIDLDELRNRELIQWEKSKI